VFRLTVAVACVLAGAKNFREIGDQGRGLPQDVLRRLGGQPPPLLRKIIAPSEKRIRTHPQRRSANPLVTSAQPGPPGDSPEKQATRVDS